MASAGDLRDGHYESLPCIHFSPDVQKKSSGIGDGESGREVTKTQDEESKRTENWKR